MTRRWPVFGVGLALLWLFIRGVSLAPIRILAEFLIGLSVSLPVAYALRRFYLPEVNVAGGLRGIPPALIYAGLFVRELLTANVDVAYRVLAPSMPIEPAVVEVPLRVETDLAITTIATSITLTPGTLTMDHDADTNTLYVHAISGGDREAVVDPIRSWEDYALRIFGEEAEPGDPVPPRPTAQATARAQDSFAPVDRGPADRDAGDGETPADESGDPAEELGGERDG
jgi:multicomponent Na+:H+ antiporter subunit E